MEKEKLEKLIEEKVEERVEKRVQEELEKRGIQSEEETENSQEEQNEEVSRRSFLKKLGAGALGLGALSLTPTSALNVRSNDLSVYAGNDASQEFQVNDGGPVEVMNSNLSISSDLVTLGGTTIWDSSNSYIPQGRLQNDSVTVAGNSISLGSSTDISHSDLSDAPSSAHHSRYSDSEARSAVSMNDVSPAGSELDMNNKDIVNIGSRGNKINIGNVSGINGISDSNAFGMVARWDTDFAFFGLRDYGADRKDVVINNEQNADNIRLQVDGNDRLFVDGAGDVDIPAGQLSEQGNRIATRIWTNNNASVPNADYADNAGQADHFLFNNSNEGLRTGGTNNGRAYIAPYNGSSWIWGRELSTMFQKENGLSKAHLKPVKVEY